MLQEVILIRVGGKRLLFLFKYFHLKEKYFFTFFSTKFYSLLSYNSLIKAGIII